MQLDNRTNNTSLALTFEFVDTKRVLLFAAGAQVGSWLSWQEDKQGHSAKAEPQILASRVFVVINLVGDAVPLT